MLFVKFLFLLITTLNLAKSQWYDNANFYQIYPRSFKDSDGDGVGDLQGIKSKLQYIKDLGIDGVWLSPIYKSPMADFGYDISDFRDIHKEFGTLQDFDELLNECNKLGLKLVLDFVPNHSSDEHEWFKKSERRESGYEDYYIWRPPKIDGVSNIKVPPNNWLSGFRYSAWRWSEIRQEMYYHFFHYKQADLNYRNPKVVQEMKDVLTYWMEKGVAGFRIDAIPTLFEKTNPDGSLPDEPRTYNPNCDRYDDCYLDHIYVQDQDETYDMAYQWRKLVDDFSNTRNIEPKILMTESYARIELTQKYYGNGSMEGAQIPFNFELIKRVNKNSTAEDYKNVIEEWLRLMPANHMANWVLGNHDQHRLASRLGVERGDLLNILLQTLPGVAITYQGEELVMTNVHLTWEETVDPPACNSNPTVYEAKSRDPARTPFPWDDSKNAGFTTGDKTWLPVGNNYKTVNVKAQEQADNSHLKIFKRLTKIRKQPVFKKGNYVGALSNNKNVYSYKRQLNDSVAMIVLNYGSTEQTVNLTALFPMIPNQLKIYTSSLNSGLKNGDSVNSGMIKVKSNNGIVLLSDDINVDNGALLTSSQIIFVLMCFAFTYVMPLNGKVNPIAKPSWLKDTPAATSTTAAPPTKPAWARKTSEAKKDEPVVKKEEPKKEMSSRLQSREIKVPFKVEKTITPQSILKKPDTKPKQEVKEEPKPVTLRNSKTPTKTPSKSPSITPSKSPNSTPSKSPSKTPDFDSDDDEDESSYETDSSEEETDSDEESSDDEKPSYKPPSPGALRKHLIIPPLKRVSTTPSDPSEPERSTSPEHTFKKPELKKVITRQRSDAKERSPSPTEPKFFKPKLRKVPSSMKMKEPAPREKLPVVELKKAPPKAEPDKSARKMSEQFPLKPSILRAESSKKIPLPPPPPPPPPPPGLKPPPDFEKKPISQKHRETLEKLKSRPRRRPDWSEMMKEVEDSNRKLRHVQCNDRSSPIVTCKSLAKVQGQYVFETEKKNTALDKLLSEIQGGVRLKPVKTNDRSKPILDGLRKFRRQMTIEEQIMKSESKAMLADCPTSPILDDEEEDELDDIDKVRDDLQSTKQMLALELRNKEAQERENKRLMAKIANLEAELERERQRQGETVGDSEVFSVSNGAVIKSLKKEAEEAQKTSKMLEKKYQDTAEQLDHAQKEIEEQKRLISNLEKKLLTYEDGSSYNYVFQEGGGVDNGSRRQSEAVQQKESSPELELVLSEEEEDETEEQKVERAARRLKREVDMLHAKLTKLKDKETNAKSERKSLRDAMKKNHQLLKVEKKKLKKLQKEVEKMAKMMQAVEDECNNDEDNEEKASVEEESESEEEESEPESEESESEDSDSDTESQSEAEDAEDDKKKLNLEPRVKRHDGRLASLKKGNYLLEANVERLKDEIKDHKEKCEALQADLDSVIDLC